MELNRIFEAIVPKKRRSLIAGLIMIAGVTTSGTSYKYPGSTNSIAEFTGYGTVITSYEPYAIAIQSAHLVGDTAKIEEFKEALEHDLELLDDEERIKLLETINQPGNDYGRSVIFVTVAEANQQD